MIWKLELPLLSRGEIFLKIKQFWWSDWKIWTAPIIKSWNFYKNKAILLKWLENLNCPYYHELKCSQKYPRFNEVTWIFELPLLSRGKDFFKNKAILLMWLENLNCPYYHELKFSQKYGRFYKVTWKFALPLLSRGKTFAKIKPFCWRDLKIWHTLIITS